MTRFLLLLAVFATAATAAVFTSSAHALLHTWVSDSGENTNPCSKAAPCRTFQGAFNKTDAGGVISCVDSGSFGVVTINKSVTIYCEGAIGEIRALGFGVQGVTVNAAATDVV